MRFMIVVKANADSEAGKMPTDELIAIMGRYHEELAKAGVLLEGNGLRPTSQAWRVKYSGDKKEIDVSVSTRANEVLISVRDHGIGIAASEQKKIFDKFYRVSSGLVHDVKGSGLGLAIVSHVVRAHGGRVEVVSAPGQGSTFTMVLPGATPVPSPARSPEVESTHENTEFA
jgi:sensor histidine kinase regulating citrate/malate metabolism